MALRREPGLNSEGSDTNDRHAPGGPNGRDGRNGRGAPAGRNTPTGPEPSAQFSRQLFPVRVDPWVAGVWLVLAVVLGLGGRYIGGGLQMLRFWWLFLPPASLLWLAVAAAGLRYHQEFSTDHPGKGASVAYRLVITNESRLPACRVSFALLTGHLSAGVEHISMYPPWSRAIAVERTMLCPVRGVYELGLSSLGVRDPLGLVTWRLQVWHRTFYVAPRVLTPSRGVLRPVREMPGAERAGGEGRQDVSLFRELVEYRAGVDVRRMAWKRFAATGRAVVREFDSAVDYRVRIVLDTRPVDSGDRSLDVTVEDVSIEAAVALAFGCLRDRTPATIERCNAPPVYMDGWSREPLERFVRESVGVFFQAPIGPVETARAVRDAGLSRSDAPVIYITHRADSEVIDLVSDDRHRPRIGALFNTRSCGDGERARIGAFAARMRSHGHFCIALDRADDLTEEVR